MMTSTFRSSIGMHENEILIASGNLNSTRKPSMSSLPNICGVPYQPISHTGPIINFGASCLSQNL
jgi:hypothetical protein